MQQEFNFPLIDKDLPPGAVLVDDRDMGSGYRNRSFYLSEKETDKCVTKRFIDLRYHNGKEVNRYFRSERHQKFLVVNGPDAGQTMTEETGALKGYARYISSGLARRSGKQIPRNVLVFA